MSAKQRLIDSLVDSNQGRDGVFLTSEAQAMLSALEGDKEAIHRMMGQIAECLDDCLSLPKEDTPRWLMGVMFCAICFEDYFESGKKDLERSFSLKQPLGAPPKDHKRKFLIALYVHRQGSKAKKFESAVDDAAKLFRINRSAIFRYLKEAREEMANGISYLEFLDKMVKDPLVLLNVKD